MTLPARRLIPDTIRLGAAVFGASFGGPLGAAMGGWLGSFLTGEVGKKTVEKFCELAGTNLAAKFEPAYPLEAVYRETLKSSLEAIQSEPESESWFRNWREALSDQKLQLSSAIADLGTNTRSIDIIEILEDLDARGAAMRGISLSVLTRKIPEELASRIRRDLPSLVAQTFQKLIVQPGREEAWRRIVIESLTQRAEDLNTADNHIWGEIQPGRKAIWVAEIAGEEKCGSYRTDVIHALRRELNQGVDILRAGIEFRPRESGCAAEDDTGANEAARQVLKTRGGDLLIWGQVWAKNPVVLLLRFCSLGEGAAPALRVKLNDLREVEHFEKALAAVTMGLALTTFKPLETSGADQSGTHGASNWWDPIGWAFTEASKSVSWGCNEVLKNSASLIGAAAGGGQAVVVQAAQAGWALLTQAAPRTE